MKPGILIVFLWLANVASAQMAEVYAGHKRAGVDIMWFKYFKDKKGQPSPWLFFSRNRASTNYSNQPAWGSTNAVSYNLRSGAGLVAVGAFSANGFTPKAGVQFVKAWKEWFFFGWSVMDLQSNANADLFGLLRYTPVLGPKWQLFLQVETLNVLPTNSKEGYSLVQRYRAGRKQGDWQYGLMADAAQNGRTTWTVSENFGVFLRHEFK
jgi:hypothetical protein